MTHPFNSSSCLDTINEFTTYILTTIYFTFSLRLSLQLFSFSLRLSTYLPVVLHQLKSSIDHNDLNMKFQNDFTYGKV